MKKQSGKVSDSPVVFSSRYTPFLLGMLVVLLYAPSLKLQFTELDDSIFIRENAQYNSDPANLITSFRRGVFAEKKDTYYRPLLLNSFVLNYQISASPGSFHAVNILLHLASVLLLYRLLIKLRTEPGASGWLSALFAVHPALVQAVSWIPGRNDTLLAVCTFAGLLATLKYLETHHPLPLFFSFFWLLAALFTKESAVFLPLAMLLLVYKAGLPLKIRQGLFLGGAWVAALVVWAAVRHQAALEGESLSPAAMAAGFLERLPVLLQYFGKSLLPFNLSVFPMMRDSTWTFPVLAVVLFAVLLAASRPLNLKTVLTGGSWFLLMLLPVVLLPASINAQDFEHRLYVPFPGLLLILSETFLFTRLKPVVRTGTMFVILLLFSGINLAQQKKFSDPITFWEEAVKGAPHSAYANMMLGARLHDKDATRSSLLIRKAYSLNPQERYINFYMGKMYNDRMQSDSAEPYLLRERDISGYYETYFQLALVEFNRKNLDKSIGYMETYLQKNPYDQAAAQNYVLMLLDTGRYQKALDFANQRYAGGIPLSAELVNRIQQLHQAQIRP